MTATQKTDNRSASTYTLTHAYMLLLWQSSNERRYGTPDAEQGASRQISTSACASDAETDVYMDWNRTSTFRSKHRGC